MNQEKMCPFCRRIVRKKDRFCPYCGRFIAEGPPLSQRVVPGVSQPSQPSMMPPPATTPSYVPPPATPPPQSYVPPPATPPAPVMQPSPPDVQPPPEEKEEELIVFSEEDLKQISLRVELDQLDESMAEIRKKLEELGETISKMEVTTELEQKIKLLKAQTQDIRAKRDKLNLEKRDLPFEEELAQKKEIQERLKKLNEAYRSKKVTESAFRKLREEYEASLQEIENKARVFRAKLNAWIKKLKIDEKSTQDNIELLEARHAAGELTQKQYEAEKETYNEKLNQYHNVIKYFSGKI